MKSRAFRALMTAQAYGQCGPLTDDEASGLGLAVDLGLLTSDSDVSPGGTIRLSVLGYGLLGQLADVTVLREDPADEPPAPGM